MSLFRYEADGWSTYSGGLRKWVKSIFWIGGITLGLMWYSAVGVFVYDKHFFGYHTKQCAAEVQSSCDMLETNKESGILAGAMLVWPITVPISFALRYPVIFGLLVPVGAAGGLGLYGSYRGVLHWRDEKRRLRIEKQEETERKLREATEYLEKVAPEYAQSLLTS